MFKLPRSEKYIHVSGLDDVADALLSPTSDIHVSASERRSSSTVSTCVVVAIVLLSSILTSAIGVCIGRRYPSNDGAIHHISKYSSIMDKVDMNFHTVQFNGTFAHENIYRQDAGLEVDKAWEALGIGFGPIIVSDALAMKSGLGKDHVRIKDKYGGGYPVFVEGLHQLHCLNLLRQSLFYNYDYYHSRAEEAFSDPPDVQRWHISHCLDFLRQRLMCTIDIGVFGSVWVNTTNPHTFVDFNTKHVCRDFDAIREWARDHQVPDDLPDDWLEMPGEDVHIWEAAP